jgi:hypothetical protein
MEKINAYTININENNSKEQQTSQPGKSQLDEYLDELSEHKFFEIIANKTKNIYSEKLKFKIVQILKIINSPKIHFQSLRDIIFEGLPDEIPSLRSLVYKMLLYYLTLNVNEWEDYIDTRRAEYNSEKEKIYIKLELEKKKHSSTNSGNNSSNSNSDRKDSLQSTSSEQGIKASHSQTQLQTTSKKKTIDHPLNIGSKSKWKSYFDDLELIEEVDKDVRRTRTHMHFFFMPARTNTNDKLIISNEEITELADKKRNDPSSIQVEKQLQSKQTFETNADVMARILFIYAKKHPEVRYVQGMNEILAPIFYAFSNDQNPYFYLNLEADSYICFENLMSEIKDIFIRSLDNTETGIQTRIKFVNSLLKLMDKELWQHFQDQKVEIQFFTFRWYTVFLTQEFEMPDILRLWDSILSQKDKFEFLNLLCLSIMKLKRTELLQSDFAGIMMTLQNLDKLDVEKIIKTTDTVKADINKNYI